ncbi:cytochrome P450 4c3-like [Ornithodoros turicata]|uniref:cytochrome P450 4c3-like n=1 Tax=Ornithodoros turicata TaxID=34597 RepID=UPI003138E8CD
MSGLAVAGFWGENWSSALHWKTAGSFLVQVCVLLVAVVCVKFVGEWLRAYWYLRRVPHPKEKWPFSLVLDMWQEMSKMDPNIPMTAKMFQYLRSMMPTILDQDVTACYYGPVPLLFGVTPDTVEKIFSNPRNQNKPFIYRLMQPFIGNGIVLSDTDVWKSRRKAMTPAFHFKVLDSYVPTMSRKGEELIPVLNNFEGKYFDALPVMRMVAFGILFETALGSRINVKEAQENGLFIAMDNVGSFVVDRMINLFHWPDFTYNLTAKAKEFYKHVAVIRDYNDSIVRERSADYKARQAEGKNSFLDAMLKVHFEDGTMSLDAIRDEVSSVFIGGFDTTGTAMGYTLHLLGNHPDVQAKVHDEVDAIFGDDRDRPITVDDLKQLTYLECVIKESMRLYPPLPIVGRRIDEDIEIGKYVIPKGTMALAACFFLQRHPRFYEKPDEFIPERFMDSQRKHPFLYVPFAGGPRNCIGQKFAQREEKIILAHIMRHFNVESKLRTENLTLCMELVLRPLEGLEVKLTPRLVS